MPATTLVVGVVGIDGCGKSSTVRSALEQLAATEQVAAIGELVVSAGPDRPPRTRTDIPLSRTARLVGAAAKGMRRPNLYKNLKILEFIERTHIRSHLLAHDAPAVVLGDGDPLVNVSAWSAAKYLHRELADDDRRLSELVRYIAGSERIPMRELPYYLRHVWQLAVANRLHLVRFPPPDLVVLLHIAPSVSLERIRSRGRPLQTHENETFLAALGDGYDRVCVALREQLGIDVVRLDVDALGQDETARGVVEAVRSSLAARRARPAVGPIAPDEIEVIATTMSGSFADQRKVARIEPTFRQLTERPVRVHAADSHAEARQLAHDIVAAGGRTIVSAGGAGTMNAVLEGCHVGGVLPEDLRLAFMRKGSADLVGKALHVPDDLVDASTAISTAITGDRLVPADVLAVETVEPDGSSQRMHLLGFGGLGVFGDVPRFTESRFVKYYKGLLGTLFGDLGPFYVGLGLASLTWSARNAVGRVPAFQLELDGERLPVERWRSVIFLNGDLGKDFPLGRGLPFGGGTLRVVVLSHRGPRSMLRQVRGCQTGALLDDPARYDAVVREVRTCTATPIGRRRRAMVNVDGLRLLTSGTVRVTVSGRVLLVDAAPDAPPPSADAAVEEPRVLAEA